LPGRKTEAFDRVSCQGPPDPGLSRRRRLTEGDLRDRTDQVRAGVNHVAYTWRDLGELVALYERLKAAGIKPVRPIRHGLTLSLYYADPDGDLMEFQIDVLEPDAANEFMAGPAFAANPVGEAFREDSLMAMDTRRDRA
jgi:hypothetical protein